MSTNNEIHRPTLYITVGPQCCGKTTYLKKRKIKDISIDDQPNIYVKVPWRYYAKHVSREDMHEMKKTIMFNKTMLERIRESPEGKQITSLLHMLQLDKKEMKNHVKSFIQNSTSDELEKAEFKSLCHDVKKALKKVMSKDVTLLNDFEIECYVVEGLFQGRGISNAQAMIKQHIKSSNNDVAWGNTNTLTRDYKDILKLLLGSNTRIQFVIFDIFNEAETNSTNSSSNTLPFISRDVLFYRNFKRFLSTGRYIPIQAILITYQRCQALLQQANEVVEELKNSTENIDCNDHHWLLNRALCRMTGFDLDKNYQVQIYNTTPRRPISKEKKTKRMTESNKSLKKQRN